MWLYAGVPAYPLEVWCFFSWQKTAYEMRISEWSPDVCSSDLCPGLQALGRVPASGARSTRNLAHAAGGASEGWAIMRVLQRATWRAKTKAEEGSGWAGPGSTDPFDPQGGTRAADSAECRMVRSEARTSGLQSLLPISYAVLCLKKKKKYKEKDRKRVKI